MKKFFGEFKAFINRGNVIDMAIGVIIATAFGAITNALVNNIFMPLVGLATGGTDFTDKLNWVVVPQTVDAVTGEITDPGVTIGFGVLVSAVINFLIIAFICFMIVKSFNKAAQAAERLKKEEEAAPAEEPAPEAPPAPTEAELLAEIRDLLKAQSGKEE